MQAAIPSVRGYARELCALRDALQKLEPALCRGAGAYERAVTLRNLIANIALRGETINANAYPWHSPMQAFNEARNPARGGLKCGGLTFLFMHALKAFGLDSRAVAMTCSANETESLVHTHMSSDVRIDGAWVAMDATFNVTLRDEDGPISWANGREALMRGDGIFATDDGMSVRPEWHLATQNPPVEELVRYMAVGRSSTAGKLTPVQLLGEWDGRIARADGGHNSLLASLVRRDGVYTMMAQTRVPPPAPWRKGAPYANSAAHIFPIGAGAAALRKAQMHAYRVELRDMRRELERREPRLRRISCPLERAIVLRSLVANDLPRGNTRDADAFPWKRPLEALQRASDPRGGGLKCNGLVLIYLHALNAFGIGGRAVVIAADTTQRNGQPIDTHMSAEVRVGGRWLAMDPTFNLSLSDGRQHLSWREARRLLLRGDRIYANEDGQPQRTDRHLATQRPPLEQLVRYMALGPSPRRASRPEPARALGDWDGVLHFDGGVTHKFLPSLNSPTGPYVLIAGLRDKIAGRDVEPASKRLRGRSYRVGDKSNLRGELVHAYENEARALQDLLIEIEPALAAPMSAHTRARLLQTLLHTRIARRANPALCDYPWMNPLEAVRLAHDPKQGGHDEIGFMILFMHMLKAFGIEGRTICFARHADERDGPIAYHVGVDAYLDGAWAAMDPWRNLVFFDGATPITWRGVRDTLIKGGDVAAFDARHSALVEQPFSADDFRFMHLGPMQLGPMRRTDGRRRGAAALDGWDGVFRYASGDVLDFAEAMVSPQNACPLIVDARVPEPFRIRPSAPQPRLVLGRQVRYA